MSGTANRGSLGRILHVIRTCMGGKPYELVDVGAGSGIVLAAAFCYGAKLAKGIELKKSGQADVFLQFQRILEKYDVDSRRADVQYGVDVIKCKKLPSLQPEFGPGYVMQKAVYFFCDGFHPGDRAHLFSLVGKDALVRVLVSSCGKAARDRYSKPCKILRDLNEAGRAADLPMFSYYYRFRIKMFGSGAQKTLHVFVRNL